MNAFVVVAASSGIVLLLVVAGLLRRVERRLVALHEAVAASDADAEHARRSVETAARTAAWEDVAADRARPLALPDAVDDGSEDPLRPSIPRIKAAGWAAGAGETMRRLRRGA